MSYLRSSCLLSQRPRSSKAPSSRESLWSIIRMSLLSDLKHPMISEPSATTTPPATQNRFQSMGYLPPSCLLSQRPLSSKAPSSLDNLWSIDLMSSLMAFISRLIALRYLKICTAIASIRAPKLMMVDAATQNRFQSICHLPPSCLLSQRPLSSNAPSSLVSLLSIDWTRLLISSSFFSSISSLFSSIKMSFFADFLSKKYAPATEAIVTMTFRLSSRLTIPPSQRSYHTSSFKAAA